ncbi:terminase gpA endonuclease subunit [Bradyrhizobium sp. Pa8]|uniref:terminase gpA endonuclease subunit n=1 Tax=Bradyrhizobium sp. Pa8 TaxID=3386552 RepID=UPI00403F69F9
MSSLASPFVSFGDRIHVYLEAIALREDAMAQPINAGSGELYGEVPEWAELKEKSRHSTYRRDDIPDGVLRLSITTDVQKQLIPCVIRHWGARATSWLIDWGYLRGDTAETDVPAGRTDLDAARWNDDQIDLRRLWLQARQVRHAGAQSGLRVPPATPRTSPPDQLSRSGAHDAGFARGFLSRR